MSPNKMASQAWVASKCIPWLKVNPSMSVKDVGDRLFSNFNIRLPYRRIHRGRRLALDKLFGDVEKSYELLPSLVYELKTKMPGSFIQYLTDPSDNFLRVFISFKCCIDGFKDGCRPFFGLDGCFLKGKYFGTLLAATAIDGCNGLFPLAYAVVEDESTSSWTWFMTCLCEALGTTDGSSYALITDGQKGLIEAVRCTLPNAEHRICMRHVFANMKKKFSGENMEQIVWGAARAYNEVQYLHWMHQLYALSKDAYEYLTNIPQKWSRHTFKSNACCGYITNNLSESFNAWITSSRELPLCDLLDWIRQKIMTLFNDKRLKGQSWKGTLL